MRDTLASENPPPQNSEESSKNTWQMKGFLKTFEQFMNT